MDREKVSLLYHRLGPLIYRRCLKLLANPDMARDATQEVFVRMLRHRHKLSNDRTCLPWLYRVATNYCLNKLRDSKRMEFKNPEELPEPVCEITSERRLGARQHVLALLHLVDKMTQQIAVFAYLDGMNQQEIAEVMGISRKTVGKKLDLLSEKLQGRWSMEPLA